MKVTIKNNFKLAHDELHAAVLRALESCGMDAEGYAKDMAPSPGEGGTGDLRKSIAHQVLDAEQEMHVGTNKDYAVYQEMGTGIYAENGDGRQDPWVYRDDEGNFHWTRGVTAKPFIKPSIADHVQEHIDTIKKELQNG